MQWKQNHTKTIERRWQFNASKMQLADICPFPPLNLKDVWISAAARSDKFGAPLLIGCLRVSTSHEWSSGSIQCGSTSDSSDPALSWWVKPQAAVAVNVPRPIQNNLIRVPVAVLGWNDGQKMIVWVFWDVVSAWPNSDITWTFSLLCSLMTKIKTCLHFKSISYLELRYGHILKFYFWRNPSRDAICCMVVVYTRISYIRLTYFVYSR